MKFLPIIARCSLHQLFNICTSNGTLCRDSGDVLLQVKDEGEEEIISRHMIRLRQQRALERIQTCSNFTSAVLKYPVRIWNAYLRDIIVVFCCIDVNLHLSGGQVYILL